jgi:hypothetical protein
MDRDPPGAAGPDVTGDGEWSIKEAWPVADGEFEFPDIDDEPPYVRSSGVREPAGQRIVREPWVGSVPAGPPGWSGPGYAIGTPEQRERAFLLRERTASADGPGTSGGGHGTRPGVLRARLSLLGAQRRAGWARCGWCDQRVTPRLGNGHPSCRRAAERQRAADALYGARVVAAELVRGPITELRTLAHVLAGDVTAAVRGPFRDAWAAVRRDPTDGLRPGSGEQSRGKG